MDKGCYICGVLEYNTVTWWNFDDATIIQYSGYPMYLYDNLWIYIEQKRGKVILDGSDRIVSMIYIDKDIISLSTYYFITGKSVSKDMEHIKERIADFTSFKEEVEINEIICNKIQTSISSWNEDLETVIENNE